MMWGRQSQLRGIGLGELGCTRAITCEFGAGIEQGERCVHSFGGVSLSFSAEVFACVSEGGKGEEMALWFGVALFIYHRVLDALAGTGVSLFGPLGRGSECCSERVCVCRLVLVCLPGAVCALALFSPGHAQAWNSQESPSPSQQLFHSQAKHAGPLAE